MLWSEKDIDFLKENSDLDPLILGFLLNRSFRSIDHKTEILFEGFESILMNKILDCKSNIAVLGSDT